MKTVTILIAGALCFGLLSAADAAKKKSTDGAPTAEQRKRMYKEGLEWCRKLHGSRIHYVRVEKHYGKWSFVCYISKVQSTSSSSMIQVSLVDFCFHCRKAGVARTAST
jgi:hypothetical protein